MGPELDLYYMRNRWYEPGTGRFLSEDPIGLQGGINPVSFGASDPINGRDPNGLCPPCDGAYRLPEITVEAPLAPWPFSTPRESGFSSGFGTRGGSFGGFTGLGNGAGVGGGGLAGSRNQVAPESAPSCTQLAVETAISVGFDLAGAGLIKRSKTLFEGGVRWFTLAGKLPPGRGTIRRGLGAAQFAESRHVASQAQEVLRIGGVFSAITISDLPDAVGFAAGFVPGVGGLISGAIGVGQVIACLSSQES